MVKTSPAVAEQRQWGRLNLAFPVFVKGTDLAGGRFTELASALNVSAGGALLALRRYLRPNSDIVIEIPAAPLLQAASSRKPHVVECRTLRVTACDHHYEIGVEFSTPLPT